MRWFQRVIVEILFTKFESSHNGVVHVGIGVACESSAKQYVGFGIGHGSVAGIDGSIACVVDGIIGFLAWGKAVGVFVGDYGGGLLRARSKVFVLNDTGVGHLPLSVVDYGIALKVGCIEPFVLKAQTAVVEVAVAVIVKLVDAASVECAAGLRMEFVTVGKVVGAQAYIGLGQQGVDECIVSPTLGYALVAVVEIVVVEGEAEGQPLDDESRQLGGGTAPLLFGIPLDESLVNVASAQCECLLLKVGGLCDVGKLAALLVYFGLCLGRSAHAPQLVEGVHVEGQVIELALIAGQGGVDKVVELGKLVDILPHLAVGGVEYVGAVLVYPYIVDELAVEVATCVLAFVNDEATFAGFGGLVGKHGAKEAAANYEIIVHTELGYGGLSIGCGLRERNAPAVACLAQMQCVGEQFEPSGHEPQWVVQYVVATPRGVPLIVEKSWRMGCRLSQSHGLRLV